MDVLREIKLKSKQYTNYTAENLAEMVKTPSESGGEEAVINTIKGQLINAGIPDFWIDRLGNLIAQVGNGPKKLAFDAHIDTVGPGDESQWELPVFSGNIEGDYVHGRGTVDQKGGAASMVTAARILNELEYNGDYTIYFVFSIMEEDCDGMCWRSLIERDGLKPDFCVITEPTNLGLYRGHRGRMEMEVRFSGVSCHGSAPERGDNAIYRASRFALEVEKLNERLKYDEFLGKGTITATMIRSESPSLCAVADFAMIHLDRRLTWGETKDTAIAEIEEILDDKGKVSVPEYRRESYRGDMFVQEKYFPTWKYPIDHPLVQAGAETHRQLFDQEPRIDKWTFSTNGVAISGVHGIPCIGFGPGNEVHAHAPNEKTPIDDLEKAARFYAYLPYILEGGK